MTMRFAREPFSESLIAEMRPLWETHHAEIPQLGIPLEPNLDLYRLMNQAGKLRIFICRQGTELVGYQVCIVGAHHHNKSSLQSIQDILYIRPSARKGLAGYRFISWCDDQLATEGVQVSFKCIDAKHDFGNLLRRMGYELTDLTYARKLEVA